MAQHAAEHGKEQLPLKDVVLCSTSLPQDVRIRLADIAQTMGASHKLDLTGEVTHLVVGDIDTPKYKYVAKERPDIVVLTPAWIDAVREVWTAGGDVDLEGLEKAHRSPTLTGLKVCMTGVPELAERNRISSMIEHEGAEYHGDLTKQVTHLIVANSDGSAKYRAAKEWGIHTVSLKWLSESAQRGMALEPKYYDPTMPEEEQGKGAFRREAGTSLGKRTRADESQSANQGGKRKLRRHASRRLEDHSQDMWQDISAADISTVAPTETDQWTAGDEESQNTLGRPAPRPQVRQSMDAAEIQSARPPSNPEGLFSGWRITIQGFEKDKAKRLTQYLEPNGAQVVKRLEDLESHEDEVRPGRNCILVPHAQPAQHMHIATTLPGAVTATEWWVERCIHYKQIIDPEQDILSQPLWNLDILGFSKLTISTTGFSGVDYRQVAQAIKLTGAAYQEQLTPSISVLVCGSSSVKKEKAYYAKKHMIPVVSAEWLWTCLKSRRKTSFERFKIGLPEFDPSNIAARPSAPSPAPNDTLSRSNSMGTRKDAQAPTRLSNTRKRQATPSLPLHTNKLAAKPQKASGPFVHEDEDDDHDNEPGRVGNDSLLFDEHTGASTKSGVPLRNISPNASPRKSTSADSHKEAMNDDGGYVANDDPEDRQNTIATHPTSHVGNASVQAEQPPPRAPADWTADLASIMERQQRRTASSEQPHPAQRLKHRKLGRAPSGSSLTNRTNPGSAVANTDGDAAGGLLESHDETPEASFVKGQEDLPSTQIGYETPEAEAARLQMAKRMGTSYSDEGAGTRLASLGMVRDSSDSAAAAGGRSRNRTRR